MKEDCYGIGGFGQCLSHPVIAEKSNSPRLCPENHVPSLLFFHGETEAAGRISPFLGCPGHLRAGFQRGFGVNFVLQIPIPELLPWSCSSGCRGATRGGKSERSLPLTGSWASAAPPNLPLLPHTCPALCLQPLEPLEWEREKLHETNSPLI